VSQKYFDTSLGARYVDQFTPDEIANEAKVGYQSRVVHLGSRLNLQHF